MADGAQGVPPQNEQNKEEEDQEASLTVDEAPPAHHHKLGENKLKYDHCLIHNFTLLAGIIAKGPQIDMAVDLQNCIMAVGLVFNQMGAKAGIKQYGNKAIQAIVDECKQLDEKKAFKPRNRKDLTELDRKRALQSITLVKEKCYGRIKGRTVADGRGRTMRLH